MSTPFLSRAPFLLLLLLAAFTSCVPKKKLLESQALNAQKDQRIQRSMTDSVAMKRKIEELSLLNDSLEKRLATTGKVTTERSVVSKTRVLSTDEEYQKKALMVYGFTKNIEWTPATSKGDFIIGVFGSSPIYDKLKSELEGKRVGNQLIFIKQFTTTANLTNCHILYVTNAAYGKIAAIRDKIDKFPTLIVAEEETLKNDSHINLTVEGKTVKYAVNKEGINRAQLKASSKLVILSE